MRKRIVIFGCGEGGALAYKKLKKHNEVLAFVDNDSKKQGTQFEGLPIIAPRDIEKQDCDTVYVASMWRDEIYDQLTEDLNIPPEKIEVLSKSFISKKPAFPWGCLILFVLFVSGGLYCMYSLLKWIFS